MMKLSILLALTFAIAKCQENAGGSVAPSLIECYNTTEFKNRDNRPPATINVLIDLIRRVEDGKSVQDARSLAIELVHRFRQDGIREFDIVNKYSLPYSPKGYQVDKNRVLLTTFIPGSAISFPNETLTAYQKCTLHFMMSNTFEMKVRGDESTVCTSLGKYQSRLKRETEGIETNGAEDVDSEVFPQTIPRGYDSKDGKQNISECPIESGVIYTRSGSIQAGTVIGAIAAAFENQKVTEEKFVVDSVYAATLSGDIVETALIQGTSKKDISIGLGGGWNNTLAPKYYFIDKATQDPGYEMTDAEIRSDLDGLIIGKEMASWRNQFQNIKISQILDMYYSSRGVFSKKFRACNRQENAKPYEEELDSQTVGFAYAYDKVATFQGTIMKDDMPKFVEPALTKFKSYDKINKDMLCAAEESIRRTSTDITIIVDTKFQYAYVYSAISHILDNIDVNHYESNYTILNGNGETLIKSSNSILDFHAEFNATNYSAYEQIFDVTKSIQSVQKLFEAKGNADKQAGNVGGKSTIVLWMPSTATISSDTNYFAGQKEAYFDNFFPDTKFMVMGPGDTSSYSSLASSPEDIFKFDDTLPLVKTNLDGIKGCIKRIADIPRKLVNPRCGVSMDGEASSNAIELYVEPGTANYYKISPNYIVGEGTRSIKIRSVFGTTTVCSSRSDPKPSNGTTNCEILASGEKTLDFSDTCVDAISDCSPIYLSIQTAENKTTLRCTDKGCRFPDNAKVTLTIEGFECASGADQMIASLLLTYIVLFFSRS